MSYPIASNPAVPSKPGRPVKYPWYDLAIGEGFVIPVRPIYSVRAQCSLMNKATGKCFKASVCEGGSMVIRIS